MFECKGRTMRIMRLSRVSAEQVNSADREHLVADLHYLSRREIPSCAMLTPLIVSGAKRWGLWGEIDTQGRRLLEARRLQLVVSSARQRELLRRLVDRFKVAGLSLLLLKGSAFHGTLYSPDGNRGAGDVDILVRRDQFGQACDEVASMNAKRRVEPGRRVSSAVDYERPYVVADSLPVLVEVHRGLTNPIVFRIDENSLWQRSAPHPDFRGDTVRALSAKDNLLHLAVHGYRHLRAAGHGLLDTHEIVCQQSPNWDDLIREARQWGAAFALYLLLGAAVTHMETPVPRTVLAKLRPVRWRESVADTVYRITKDRDLRHGQAAYRAVQFAGQLAVPDSRLRVLGFQGYYAGLRMLDLIDDPGQILRKKSSTTPPSKRGDKKGLT